MREKQNLVSFTIIVTAIGTPNFMSVLVGEVAKNQPTAFSMVFAHRAGVQPEVLHDELSPSGYSDGVENYVNETFSRNPFYQALVHERPEGLLTAGNLKEPKANAEPRAEALTASADEELGFLTRGWPAGMQECVLSAPLSNETVIEISFSSASSEQNDLMRSHLEAISPFLIECIKKHFEVASINRDLGAREIWEKLTEREVQVAQLILTGHGSEAIGLKLNLALPTVKTHRRNIYRKLGISSQAELFALMSHPLG